MGSKSITLSFNESVLCEGAELADRFYARFLGLMGQTSLPPDYCLILTPCSAIHMAFMRIALDVAYLDREGKVVGLQWELKPWQLGKIFKGAHTVLEAPVNGVLRKLALGDRVTWK